MNVRALSGNGGLLAYEFVLQARKYARLALLHGDTSGSIATSLYEAHARLIV